jgi:hypothetical protein
MPRCASCNQPVSKLLPCTWDSSLAGVGECCEFHNDEVIETPIEASCMEEVEIVLRAKTVREVVERVSEHRKHCIECMNYPKPKMPWANLEALETRRKGSSTEREGLREFRRAA